MCHHVSVHLKDGNLCSSVIPLYTVHADTDLLRFQNKCTDLHVQSDKSGIQVETLERDD